MAVRGNCGAVRHLGRCRGRRAGQRELAGLPTAGAGGEGGDREKRRRRERLWCGPEKLPTLQATGGWGSRKRGGPRKARASKSWACGAGLEKRGGRTVVPGKAWAWKSNSTVGLEKRRWRSEWRCQQLYIWWGLETVNRGADKGWRGKSGRKQEQETAGGGAGGDSGRPMAAGSYFSSQPKRRRSPKRRKSSSRPPEVL